MPIGVIVPPAVPSWTLHVTAALEVPVTVAENDAVAQESAAPEDGVIVTTTGAGGAVTVTIAVSDFDGSCWLVPTTAQVPATAGAV
jgi:hypothetical protein